MGEVRRATAADAPALVRLRAVMLDAMGVDVSGTEWRVRAEDRFRELLADGDTFAAYVVESDAGQVVASGAAWVDRRIPSPGHDGLDGHIASMATDVDHRGQGHASAVFAALMEWLQGRNVRRVDLFATEAGERLYRNAGFRNPTWPSLVWTRGDARG